MDREWFFFSLSLGTKTDIFEYICNGEAYLSHVTCQQSLERDTRWTYAKAPIALRVPIPSLQFQHCQPSHDDFIHQNSSHGRSYLKFPSLRQRERAGVVF